MEIYLIRHTKPDIGEEVIYGHLDVDLVESFEEEASIVVGLLPENIACVYSSPSKRCLRLAEKINGNVRTDERLQELDFGVWEGMKWTDIDQRELQKWMDDWLYMAPEQGESMTQMAQRVHRFWQQIVSGKETSVAIVSHAGVMKMIYTFVLDKKIEEAFELELEYGSVCKVNTKERTFRVLYNTNS